MRFLNGARAQQLKEDLEKKYGVSVVTLDAQHMTCDSGYRPAWAGAYGIPVDHAANPPAGYMMELPWTTGLMSAHLQPVREAVPQMARMRDHQSLARRYPTLKIFHRKGGAGRSGTVALS